MSSKFTQTIKAQIRISWMFFFIAYETATSLENWICSSRDATHNKDPSRRQMCVCVHVWGIKCYCLFKNCMYATIAVNEIKTCFIFNSQYTNSGMMMMIVLSCLLQQCVVHALTLTWTPHHRVLFHWLAFVALTFFLGELSTQFYYTSSLFTVCFEFNRTIKIELLNTRQNTTLN